MDLDADLFEKKSWLWDYKSKIKQNYFPPSNTTHMNETIATLKLYYIYMCVCVCVCVASKTTYKSMISICAKCTICFTEFKSPERTLLHAAQCAEIFTKWTHAWTSRLPRQLWVAQLWCFQSEGRPHLHQQSTVPTVVKVSDTKNIRLRTFKP